MFICFIYTHKNIGKKTPLINRWTSKPAWPTTCTQGERFFTTTGVGDQFTIFFDFFHRSAFEWRDRIQTNINETDMSVNTLRLRLSAMVLYKGHFSSSLPFSFSYLASRSGALSAFIRPQTPTCKSISSINHRSSFSPCGKSLTTISN